MSAIERSIYVAVGAADLAVEKVRELPAVKSVVERTSKLREGSLVDQAREIEPKVRKQAEQLQARGETVVKRVRKEAKDLQQQVREFPTEARKQLQDFPESARKQANELRGRFQKRAARDNGKPAPKTSAKATSGTTAKSTS